LWLDFVGNSVAVAVLPIEFGARDRQLSAQHLERVVGHDSVILEDSVLQMS
jgi:hypothetical protein